MAYGRGPEGAIGFLAERIGLPGFSRADLTGDAHLRPPRACRGATSTRQGMISTPVAEAGAAGGHDQPAVPPQAKVTELSVAMIIFREICPSTTRSRSRPVTVLPLNGGSWIHR